MKGLSWMLRLCVPRLNISGGDGNRMTWLPLATFCFCAPFNSNVAVSFSF